MQNTSDFYNGQSLPTLLKGQNLSVIFQQANTTEVITNILTNILTNPRWSSRLAATLCNPSFMICTLHSTPALRASI